MSLSESSQPLKDRQQITFMMRNRFWSLIKNLLTPLPVPNRQYQAGWNATKIKWKIQASFILYFKFGEGTPVKSYKIQLPVYLFLVLNQFLYQQISFFTTF